MQTYSFFHITIQPKNCDGSNREDFNFLTPHLVTLFDTYLNKQASQYARAIERNKDHTGQHYHYVLYAKEKLTIKKLKDDLLHIIQDTYAITDQAHKRLIYIKHKTRKQANLCAGGYLTKQYHGTAFKTNLEAELIKDYKLEYETLVSKKKLSEFSEWVLAYEKRKFPTSIRTINKYLEVISIIIENDPEFLNKFNSSNFHNFYLSILYKYKISYEYSDVKKFHRQILEYLYCLGKSTKIDNESLVNLMRFNKSDEFKIIEHQNQYEENTILNYWSLK